MVAIYARQSVDKKDSLSIDAQIEMCKKIVNEECQVFIDKGYSGKNTNRPAFQELLDAIETGHITRLLCYRLDRISRSIVDFSTIWEILERHKVEFCSVTENFDTSSPMGRAMLNIVMTFAQLERETIAERIKVNYFHRFSKGVWPGGPAPYGYDLDKIEDFKGAKSSSLAVNVMQSEVVNLIFKKYLEQGQTLRSIAKYLTENGIHGPKREAWDTVTVSRILHNPVYVKASENIYFHFVSQGFTVENDMEEFDGIHACLVIGHRDRSKGKYNAPEEHKVALANHLGIIEPDVWLAVQEKLSSNKQISRDTAGKHTWLTGVLKCKCCGYALKVNHVKSEKKKYLICSGRSNMGICENRISIDIGELETVVEEKITEVIEEFADEVNIVADNKQAEAILDIENKIERLINALSESSEVSAGYISKQIEKLHKERENLIDSGNLKSQKDVEKINFKAASFEEKKIICKQFINSITITGDDVEINWKI